MAQHNVPLLLGLLLLFNSPACAQGSATSSSQSNPKTTNQQAAPSADAPAGTGSSAQSGVIAAPLPSTGYTIAQSIISAQTLSGSPVVVLYVQPPPSPTLAYADFWNAVGELRGQSSQFLTDLSTAFSNDPIGVSATALSSGTSLVLMIAGDQPGFEEIDTGLSLVSGGISDSVPSTIADLLGARSVDLSSGGSSVAKNIYSVLSTANTISDTADQGAAATEPQILPVQPPEALPAYSPAIRSGSLGALTSSSTSLGSNASSDSTPTVADILQRARQSAADLSNAEVAAQQENSALDTRLAVAEAQASALRAQQAQGFSISIPADWIVCQCPAQHPGAGILVNAGGRVVQYHTPLLHCN